MAMCSGKDLVKSLIQKSDIYTNLKQFLAEAEEYSNGSSKKDIVAEYLRTSGSCTELLDVLQGGKKTPPELAIVFNVLEQILLRITEDLNSYKTVSVGIVHKLLQSHMRHINSMLHPHHKSNQIKSALKLLIAIAAQGTQATRDLVAVFKFQNGNLLEVMNRRNLKDSEDVRTCFLHFIVALLVVGDNSIIRTVMEQKGFLNAVFHKIHHDRASSIHLFLSTIQNKIVENSSISKTLKIRLLNDNTLKFVLELYMWEGARKIKTSGKRKFTSNDKDQLITEPASEGEIATVRDCAHQFMLAICCSHKNGIIFHGYFFDNMDRNPNHVITNLLLIVKKPYADKRSSEFVIKVLQTCPEQLRFYLPSLKDAVLPRSSTFWFQAMKFIKKIIINQEPLKSVLRSGEKKPLNKLTSVVVSLCIPSILSKDTLTENLQHESHQVVYTLLDYIQEVLDKVTAIVESSDRELAAVGYDCNEIDNFYDSIKKTTYTLLPDICSLFKCWEHLVKCGQKINDSQLKENPVPEEIPVYTLGEHFQKLLELFERYSDLFRETFKGTPMNYGNLLYGVRQYSTILQDKLPAIEIAVLSLIANTSHFIDFKEFQEELPLTILLNIYLKTDDSKLLISVKRVLYVFLSEIGLSNKHKWEIDVWMKSMKKCPMEHHDKILQFIETVLRMVMENPALCMSYIEEIIKEVKICKNKVDIPADGICNGSLDKKNEVSVIQLDCLELCSYIVPASIHIANGLTSVDKKVVKIYLSEVFQELLHHQDDPKPFCALLRKCHTLPVSFKTYINIWTSNNAEQETSVLQYNLPDELFKEMSPSSSLQAICMYIHRNNASLIEKRVCKKFKSYIKCLTDLEELESIVRQIIFYINVEIQNEEVVHEKIEFLSHLLKIAIFNVQVTNFEMDEKNSRHSGSAAVSFPDFLKVVLNHTLMPKWFLESNVLFYSETLTESSSHLTNFALTVIKLYNEISPIDFINVMELYKNKVISYLTYKISPKKKKPIAKDKVNFEELMRTFMPCFSRKEVHSIISIFVEIGVKNIQKLDPTLAIFTQLVNLYNKNELQNYLEIPSFVEVCFIVIKCILERKESCSLFIDKVLTMISLNPNKFTSLNADIVFPLLEVPDEKCLLLIKSLVKCNVVLAKSLKEFLVEEHMHMGSWHSQFIIEIINMHMASIDDADSFTVLKVIYKHYWHAIKENFKPNENCQLNGIRINKVLSLILKEKLLADTQVRKLIEEVAHNMDQDIFPPALASSLLKELFYCINEADGINEKSHIMCAILKIFITWFLSMMKNSDDNEQHITKVLTELVATSQKLNSTFVDMKVLEEISWSSLLRKSLKNGLRDPVNGYLMLQLVNNIISSIDRALQSDMSPSITEIHQMVFGHSNFLTIMLEEVTQNSPVKEALLQLVLTLTSLEPSVVKKEHVPIFLGSYHATLKRTDQLLLYLINIYEENAIQLTDFKPFLWGLAGINHYSVKKELSLSLWKEPRMEEVVSLFDEEQMCYSLLHFPLTLKLEPWPQKLLDKESYPEKIYDPRFLLPLFSSLLAPGCLIHCRKFIEAKCFSFTIMSLSSLDPTMRAAGYHILHQYHDQLEGSLFKERKLWLGIIELIKNSLGKDNTKLPCLVTLFLSKMINIAFKSEDPMYWPLFQFVSLKPSIDLFNVPEFYKLFNSTDLQQHIHQNWILNHLAEGLRTSLDFHICEKRYIFPILLTFYNSPISSQNSRMLILKILEQAIKIPSVARKLLKVHGLLTWIIIVVQTSKPSEEELAKLKIIAEALGEQVSKPEI